ncbi:hypothetical protein SPRG_21052 [Saprolegnia parasitica CBS 223.65]|uniref:Secreted protein n=1 Tax=Saprolegnia parasitica (strain CBS 223.65) TaxID=695850 RepID=A0A067BX97_SAPPC|nr:hypothetical protein SPRG_21052 [Saprolegnia parasitica CBS 223.65]KDO22903.1 hypothetical protein SPRG_21052 [Saprolegnia parasitica CBS 223.65]|eukprot:XP_012206393.1 hypothetical protein SPRG_21052 [Saprolegnia parasitica CBS 223.65]
MGARQPAPGLQGRHLHALALELAAALVLCDRCLLLHHGAFGARLLRNLRRVRRVFGRARHELPSVLNNRLWHRVPDASVRQLCHHRRGVRVHAHATRDGRSPLLQALDPAIAHRL